MENIIEIRDLEKSYNDFKLGPIDLDLNEGMIIGLIGENGAGKTTLLKLILDLAKKDNGSIKIKGIDDKNQKEKIAFIFDEIKFPKDFKISQLESVFKGIFKNWDSKKFYSLLREFKLDKSKKVKELSKGMKMKLQLAVSLSHDPNILIMDEVTSGLDPVFRDDLQDILLDFIQDPNHMVFSSTHNLVDIEKIADKIIFLNQGNIVFNKDKDELLENYGIMRVPKSKLPLIEKDDYIVKKENQFGADLLTDKIDQIKEKYKDLIIDKPTLDEIMLLYLKGIKND